MDDLLNVNRMSALFDSIFEEFKRVIPITILLIGVTSYFVINSIIEIFTTDVISEYVIDKNGKKLSTKHIFEIINIVLTCIETIVYIICCVLLIRYYKNKKIAKNNISEI